MLVSEDKILELIPQRPPFVMIDSLIHANEIETITAYTVKDDNPLVSNGVFQEGGILENIAQTAASGVGYRCQLTNSKVPVGFIGAIKKINIFDNPLVGDKLQTTVKIIANVMDASIIGAEVLCGDRKIASCEMNIFLKK